jgi:hypothetical protein
MPEQKSQRGAAVTGAPFENPFETNITRFGMKGLNLIEQIDMVEPDELTRMLNVIHYRDGGLTTRPGQVALNGTAVGTTHHSMRRLNNPSLAGFTRVHGVDTALYIGSAGPATNIDSGYSGDPLTLVPYRTPQSGETWMFVADRTRMRKVRSDGLDLPIGLPAPTTAASPALAPIRQTNIANFTDDGTQVANWTATRGQTYDDPPVQAPPTETLAITDPDGANAIHMGSVVPGAPNTQTPTGYYNYWGVAVTRDLSKVGTKDASDDDYIHLWVNFSHTQFIEELRIYFVCSETFNPSVLPGGANTTANQDFYVKTIAHHDFSAYLQAQLGAIDTAEIDRVRTLREQAQKDGTTRVGWGTALRRAHVAAVDKARGIAKQSSAGSDQWREFGALGIPLRVGDFQRVGEKLTTRNWANITGIILLVKTTQGAPTTAVRVGNIYLHGGSGPDTGEPEVQPYDYRYTHYDTRTGAEGNPSPVMADANFIDALRRGVNVTPTAYGDADVRQRFYRRGGTLVTDWLFLGTNTSDGGVFLDELADTEVQASASLELDNDQPISTVTPTGVTVLNQPVPALWGPLQDFLFATGDPYRPGHIYFCKPGEPDAWPPDHITEVCSPSEELMMGCLYGGQAFVFSRERLFVLYPNLSGETPTVTSTITQCSRGMINRWGLAVGVGGMYFISRDGIYRTVGGPEEWISRKIDPLFKGKTVNGMLPIDFTASNLLRLEIHENELYFQYVDTNGDTQVLVFSLPHEFWRHYTYATEPACFYSDEGNSTSTLLIGGQTSGKTYQSSGLSDDGAAIACQLRTGAINFTRPREEKRLGDQALDIDAQNVDITLQNFLNKETVTNAAQSLTGTSGRVKAIFNGFGPIPQRAIDIATDISWSSATAAPILYWFGTSVIIEPEITINRVTQWDDLGHSDEFYLTGVTFDVDTGDVDRTILIEYDLNGLINTAASLTVRTNGRHKVKFSWPAVQAHKVRIRPNDDCLAWQLFKVDWIAQPEPPRIAGWDIHFENGWDQYYTGLDLYCNTFGLDKTIEVYVDGTLVKTETVNTSGRRVHHITLPWGRGHVFRFVATDDNPGLLYDHRWHLEQEPSEQTNWNQNFTVAGTEADKYLKAIVFQCDTFGLDKTVTVEVDGVVVQTLTINADGRKVVQKAFPQQLGRVFRIFPTDNNPGRLYSHWWVFDQEPLALDRWETQEITHGLPGWHYPIWAHITLKSTADVTLTLTAYNQAGTATIKTYAITSTGGVKQKRFVPFEAVKGIMFKYVLTSTSPFWLYREETVVAVRDWGSNETLQARPFGNDDTDPTRIMTRSDLAAARPGGGTA